MKLAVGSVRGAVGDGDADGGGGLRNMRFLRSSGSAVRSSTVSEREGCTWATTDTEELLLRVKFLDLLSREPSEWFMTLTVMTGPGLELVASLLPPPLLPLPLSSSSASSFGWYAGCASTAKWWPPVRSGLAPTGRSWIRSVETVPTESDSSLRLSSSIPLRTTPWTPAVTGVNCNSLNSPPRIS